MPWLIVIPLIALPIVEIALFIKSAQLVGIGMTIILAIGAGVVGVALVKRLGIAAMERARVQMERGEMPMAEVFDGLCLALAGALLVLPGFFSDLVALALLLPPVRAGLRLWLGRHLRPATQAPQGPPVIETEYTVIRDEDDRIGRN